MNMLTKFLLAASITLGSVGCAQYEDSQSSDNGDSESADELRLAYDGPAYEGPPAKIWTEPGPDGKTEYHYSVEVPTGGWTHEFAGATTMPPQSHIVVKVDLMPPPEDAMVTQALETLTGMYTHKDMHEHIDLWINVKQPDDGDEDDYRLAASAE